MNCTCVKDLEIRLANHFKPQAGESAKAVCLGSGLQLSEEHGVIAVLNIQFRITGDKKGYTSAKGKEMPVIANFCPFCGKSAKKEKVVA